MDRHIYVLFRTPWTVDGERQYWAIPSLYVREIVPNPHLFPVPQVPAFVDGCIWYRGRIYTVLNMETLFHGPQALAPQDPVHYIAILEGVEPHLALNLGTWVMTLPGHAWTPIAEGQAIPSFADSVVGWQDGTQTRIVALLDIPRLVQRVDQMTVAFVRTKFAATQKTVRRES